jgi:heme oxygenase
LASGEKKKEEWMKEEIWKNIEERTSTKQKNNNTRSERLKEQLRKIYTELNKGVKKMARTDKKDYIEKLAEEAACRNDLKTLYKINKQLNDGLKH